MRAGKHSTTPPELVPTRAQTKTKHQFNSIPRLLRFGLPDATDCLFINSLLFSRPLASILRVGVELSDFRPTIQSNASPAADQIDVRLLSDPFFVFLTLGWHPCLFALLASPFMAFIRETTEK